jgi:hypothetical protein
MNPITISDFPMEALKDLGNDIFDMCLCIEASILVNKNKVLVPIFILDVHSCTQ